MTNVTSVRHSDFFSLSYDDPNDLHQDYIRAMKDDLDDEIVIFDHDIGDDGILPASCDDMMPQCCSIQAPPAPTV